MVYIKIVESKSVKYCGLYKNGNKQKCKILSDTLDKFQSYSFDNHTYYYTYKRSKNKTQINTHLYFGNYSCYSQNQS